MKKLLLIISLIIPSLFSFVDLNVAHDNDNQINNNDCDYGENSSVRIVNNYNVFISNGFVYKKDSNYTYIVTTSKIINNINSYKVIYSDNKYSNLNLLGYDSYNEIAVFRSQNVSEIKGVCLGNSNYLYRGQQNYLYGYFNNEHSFIRMANLSSVGQLYSNSDYKNIFKSILQVDGNNNLNGVGVYNELNELIGMISGYDSFLVGSCYMVDINKLIRVADSIIKTGNYEVNYIKYMLVDYGSINKYLKESYSVSDKVNSGVVITTFRPFKFIFGGLNQGMVIVSVNGVEINSVYELDKQFNRYEKGSSVCLKVIKKNGKEAFYYVEI